MQMRTLMMILEEASKPRSVDDLEDYHGEAIKDDCTKRIPAEIQFADFAFVWWVGGNQKEMQKKHEAFIAAEKEETIEDVRHDDMTTGQRCINPQKVQNLLDKPLDDSSKANLPVIQRWNGYNILFDGNHRVTADVLKGKPSSKCIVVHLDKYFDADGNLK